MLKVLTPAQMNAVDQATIARGIPGIILMENAAHRVVEYLASHFAPLSEQRIVVACGKGNNGGDGLAIARQLATRFAPCELHVVLLCDPAELKGDAAQNLTMLHAAGVQEERAFRVDMRAATLVIDAVLGTGLEGVARGAALDAIRHINTSFPLAKVVAVDIPSGLPGGSGMIPGEYVRADATVTFTAPKVCHAIPPAANKMGDLTIAPIGSPAGLYDDDPAIDLALVTPEGIAPVFAPRATDANKGRFGHVLIVAGARGKSGAAAMAGAAAISALRAGAGLVTVACPESVLTAVASFAPELMTEPLPESSGGVLTSAAYDRVAELAATRTVIGIGPGIGTHDETKLLVQRLFRESTKPLVVDADAINCLAGTDWRGPEGSIRILTPHPGEMSRITGVTIAEVQVDRITAARTLAKARNSTIVLKGERTLLAFPDGRVWINPTGSAAMATGGTGDILTGMVCGLFAQFPQDWNRAAAAAVYLHGLAGQMAANELGELPVIATDLLKYLGQGIRAITNV